MPDAFVSLAAWLRPQPPAAPVSLLEQEEGLRDAPAPEPNDETASAYDEWDDLDDALAAARRFRAALHDALDASLGEVLDAIAREVLGRELQLAPADLGAIVARARERYALDMPVTIRVHADDAEAFGAGERVVIDARLQPGDVVIDVRCGTIDATLAARVERVLGARGTA